MNLQPAECSQSELHYPDEPSGYLERHAWAEEMTKTHVQRRCPGCGMWRVWEERGHEAS
jgi:hypothetical protein